MVYAGSGAAGPRFAVSTRMNKVTENRRLPLPWLRSAHLAGAVLALLLGSVCQADVPVVEPQAAILEAAHSYITGLLRGTTGSTVIPGQLDTRLHLARCEAPLEAALPPGTNMQARVTVRVSCGQPRWSIFVPVVVTTTTPVLVLRRAVDRGALLGPDDVAQESRTLAGPGLAYLNQPTELTGRVVRRPLPAGSTLTADMFSAETVVHRGQDVTLLAGAGGIEVRAAGRAMMDGAAGARVQVLNLSSSRMVEGVVESAEVVRVGL